MRGLLVRNCRQRVGYLVNAVLQFTANHGFQEHGYVCLHRNLHLACGVGNGQKLNPHGERHGRVCRLELDALGLFTLNDVKRYGTYRRHAHRHAVAAERKVFYLVGRYAVFHFLYVLEIAKPFINILLRIWYLLHSAFIFAAHVSTYILRIRPPHASTRHAHAAVHAAKATPRQHAAGSPCR